MAIAGGHNAKADEAIEEIVVTATKREANLQDIPQSVTAFSDADIAKYGFDDFDDIAKFIPGLSYGRREPAGTSIVFRGVASSGLQFGARPSSSVYLDEQPITSAGVNPDPRLIDIERIEALSGPQGTLFGDASQSGTLRIITNKPDASGFEAWIEGSGSQVDGGDPGYDGSAMVNIPVVLDRLAVRLVGFRAEEGGYVDNVLGASPGGTFDNAGSLEKDVNTSIYTGGRAALRWTPDETWTVDVAAIFQDTDSEGFGDVDPDLGDLEQVRFRPESGEDQWYQLGLTLNAKLDWADALLNVSFFDRDFVYDVDATEYQFQFNQLSGQLDAASPYDVTRYDFGGDPRGFGQEKFHDKRWTVEARLATPGDSDRPWRGLIGLFYDRLKGDTLFSSGNVGFANSPAFDYLNNVKYLYTGSFVDHPTDNWFFGEYDSSMEQFAIFGEMSFDFTENFTITTGGRWFRVEEDFGLLQGNLMQEAGSPDRATDLIVNDARQQSLESGFVPKVNLTYRIDEDKLIYFTFSQGFRSGGSNPVRPSSILPRRFDSDVLDNFEWGAKTMWLDGRLKINLVAYKMKWDEFQIQVSDPQPTVFALGVVNFPEAEISGIEGAFEWIPADGWTLSSTLTWNDAEISETAILFPDADEPVVAAKGTRLPLTPDWKASVGVEYEFQQEWLGALPYLRFDYSYTGESINSLEGLEAVVFESGPRPQHPYHVGDFSIGMEAELWSAAFYIDNVWDERGEVFFNNRWVRPRLSVNQPRTFGITFRKSFK